MINNETNRHPVLLSLLGVGLTLIICSSLYMRVKNPGLTVYHNPVRETAARMPEPVTGEINTIGELMKLAAAQPENLAIIIRLTEALLSAGQWSAAENFAQKGLSLTKGEEPDPKLLYLLALAYHNQGQHNQAADILEKLLSKNENASARYSLGILYTYFLNKKAEGKNEFYKASLIPDLSPALRNAINEELEK